MHSVEAGIEKSRLLHEVTQKLKHQLKTKASDQDISYILYSLVLWGHRQNCFRVHNLKKIDVNRFIGVSRFSADSQISISILKLAFSAQPQGLKGFSVLFSIGISLCTIVICQILSHAYPACPLPTGLHGIFHQKLRDCMTTCVE